MYRTVEEIKRGIPELPEGKKQHFFVVYAEEDREFAYNIAEHLEEDFDVKCVFEGRDLKPGMDQYNFFHQSLITSVKVVLLLSRHFAEDRWCIEQQSMCLGVSLDKTIPCIVPVALEDIQGITEFILFTTVAVVNACLGADEAAAKIVDSISDTDVYATMVPFECVNVFARFENGYTIDIPVEKVPTMCRRPSKYQFYTELRVLAVLEQSNVKLWNVFRLHGGQVEQCTFNFKNVNENFLRDVVQFVNKQPVMNTFDFLKKRNIACWGIVFLSVLSVLLTAVVTGIYTMVAFTSGERPSFSGWLFPPFFVAILAGPGMIEFYAMVIVILVLAVPRWYGREKKDVELQEKLCQQFFGQFVDNNVIVVYTGRRDRKPNLQIMRYSFDKCRKFLIDFLRRNEQRLNLDRTIEEYADMLIERHVQQMTKSACISYDSLPGASYNRHNMRGGKMCICQLAEQDLQQRIMTNNYLAQHVL